jgi:hypothetical protein
MVKKETALEAASSKTWSELRADDSVSRNSKVFLFLIGVAVYELFKTKWFEDIHYSTHFIVVYILVWIEV